jgi:hypothetical protein
LVEAALNGKKRSLQKKRKEGSMLWWVVDGVIGGDWRTLATLLVVVSLIITLVVLLIT